MNGNRIWQFAKAWARNLISVRSVSALLSSFGVLWLCVEISGYFFGDTQLPSKLQRNWWLFFAAGLAISAVSCLPRLRVSHKLSGRDATIEIAVGDMFDFPGALVVGTNTTFDTRLSRQLISEDSVQGQFTRRYYGDETQLDAELQVCLAQIDHEELPGIRVGKNRKYPVGTVVRLNPRDRTAYFVAIAHMNKHGVASGTYEDLQEALNILKSEIKLFVNYLNYQMKIHEKEVNKGIVKTLGKKYRLDYKKQAKKLGYDLSTVEGSLQMLDWMHHRDNELYYLILQKESGNFSQPEVESTITELANIRVLRAEIWNEKLPVLPEGELQQKVIDTLKHNKREEYSEEDGIAHISLFMYDEE